MFYFHFICKKCIDLRRIFQYFTVVFCKLFVLSEIDSFGLEFPHGRRCRYSFKLDAIRQFMNINNPIGITQVTNKLETFKYQTMY